MAVTSINRQDNQPVFVLHTYPFKETSLVVELFSRDFGRVAAVAKGARRPRSAMRGMLQSFQPLVAAWSGEDAHEALFDYYAQTLRALSGIQASSPDTAITLRRFELKMLQEMGYAVPLEHDEDGAPVMPERSYFYIPERGACSLQSETQQQNGVQLSGKTLLDMGRDEYDEVQTQQQSKQLMRMLLGHYLGDKPLHTRQLLIDLQEL